MIIAKRTWLVHFLMLMLASTPAQASAVGSLSDDPDFHNPFLDAMHEDERESDPDMQRDERLEKEPKPELPPQPRVQSPPQQYGDLANLRVFLHDIRLPNIGFTTASIRYVIHVRNPNARTVKAPELMYETFIGDVAVAVGRTIVPDIPPRSHRRYESGFIISYIDLGRSLFHSIQNRDFSLRIEGTIRSEGEEARFASTLHVEREEL